MRVAGTFSKGSLINASYVMTMPDFAANVTSTLDGAILMTSAPGTDPAEAKATIQAALADYPNVTVNDPADITRKAQDSGQPAARHRHRAAAPRGGRRDPRHRQHPRAVRRRTHPRARPPAGRRRHPPPGEDRRTPRVGADGTPRRGHRRRPRHGLRHRAQPGPRRRGHHRAAGADRDARDLPRRRRRRRRARRHRPARRASRVDVLRAITAVGRGWRHRGGAGPCASSADGFWPRRPFLAFAVVWGTGVFGALGDSGFDDPDEE